MHGNGSSKLIWWLMVGFASISIGGGSMWLTTIYSKVSLLEASDRSQDASVAVIISNLSEIQRRLGIIDGKLDRLQGSSKVK